MTQAETDEIFFEQEQPKVGMETIMEESKELIDVSDIDIGPKNKIA